MGRKKSEDRTWFLPEVRQRMEIPMSYYISENQNHETGVLTKKWIGYRKGINLKKYDVLSTLKCGVS